MGQLKVSDSEPSNTNSAVNISSGVLDDYTFPSEIFINIIIATEECREKQVLK